MLASGAHGMSGKPRGAAWRDQMPVRVQRKRTKGWKMPPNTVYVGRGSEWGNPYRVEEYGRCGAVARYRKHLLNVYGDATYPYHEVRGKDLACWCRLDSACHGDVLLELANR
jgi:hypothetical protein